MKDNLEKIKDILYDFSDYLIIGGIILSIVVIIGWRLDILFPETIAMVDSNNLSEVEEEIEETKKENIDLADKESEAPKISDDKESKEDQEKAPEIIKVSIPKGSPSTSIGTILMELELINSVSDFEEKVYELKLEKKLRSGDFDIRKDDSLESIVKIIANEK